MRFTMAALMVVFLAAAASADLIQVPDEDAGIVAIQQALDMAGSGDTVLVLAGVYDSVNMFTTVYGQRSAIASVPDGVTLMGEDTDDVELDQTEAEYGILLQNVGSSTVVRNLTIVGGVGRDRGREDDGDGRSLVAAIGCLQDASPTITDLRIEESATGFVIRSGSAPSIQNSLVARGSHHGVFIYENGATPAILDHLTIVDNFDIGVRVSGGNAQISNCSITHNGKEGISGYITAPTVEYCNVYANDEVSPEGEPQNYEGTLDDLTGIDGNISEEPFYCDFSGSVGYDYSVCFDSENLGSGVGGTNIGAFGGGCSDCVESLVEASSWGAIKALYR
ncbi:MAG: hypothetical protein GF405_10590 [Candidatus Eisenbacteria bacterium]|nr:hypothetical protein [Candidatus Eisenbacteria bacterium]